MKGLISQKEPFPEPDSQSEIKGTTGESSIFFKKSLQTARNQLAQSNHIALEKDISWKAYSEKGDLEIILAMSFNTLLEHWLGDFSQRLTRSRAACFRNQMIWIF